MATSLIRLLIVLAKINPAIWDAIHPHGPVLTSISRTSLGTEVELNPQPLPPLQLASVKVANQVAYAAIAAEAADTKSGAKMISSAVEDWCGTPHGHLPIPWPRQWPLPWPPPNPEPEPDVKASQLVGALTLASIASRMADGEIRDALENGAEQLAQAGLAE